MPILLRLVRVCYQLLRNEESDGLNSTLTRWLRVGPGVGVATERIYRTILDRVFNPKDHLSIALLGLPFRVEIKAIKAGSEIRFTTVPKRENDSLCIIELVLQ